MELLHTLAQDRVVIAPDNPGMGFSQDTGDTSASAEAALNAYAEFISALDVGRVDVMGWSYGGGIALLLVSERVCVCLRACVSRWSHVCMCTSMWASVKAAN